MVYASYGVPLVPLIIIGDYGREHILGTNGHDRFYIDKESGGLQYLNLQCDEGTKRYNSDSEPSGIFFVEDKESIMGEEVDAYDNVVMVSIRTYSYMLQTYNGVYKKGVVMEGLKDHLESLNERYVIISNKIMRMSSEKDYSELKLDFSKEQNNYLMDFLLQLKESGEQSTYKRGLAKWLRGMGCEVLKDGQRWKVFL